MLKCKLIAVANVKVAPNGDTESLLMLGITQDDVF